MKLKLTINDIIRLSENIEKINKLNISLPINVGFLLIKNKMVCDNIISSFLNECDKKFKDTENFNSSNEEYQNMLREEIEIDLDIIKISNKKMGSFKLPFNIINGLLPVIN